MAALSFRIARRTLLPSSSMQHMPCNCARNSGYQHASIIFRSSRINAMWFGSRVSPAFDTHDLVKRLMAAGFTSDQAEVVMESMKQAAEQYANTADSMYPTKIEMIEKNLAYKADFAAMKSDLVLMLKQDVALLKSEIHKVMSNDYLSSLFADLASFSCKFQLETVIGKETTAYQTKLEQLENKSIKYFSSPQHAVSRRFLNHFTP